MVSLLQATFEGWMEVMKDAVDVTEVSASNKHSLVATQPAPATLKYYNNNNNNDNIKSISGRWARLSRSFQMKAAQG